MEDAAGPPRADYNLKYVWLISLVAAMGGLLFGYDWVVIGGAKPFFEPYFNLTSESHPAAGRTAAPCWAAWWARSVAGGLSDKFGRKRLLIASAVLFRRVVGADRLGVEVRSGSSSGGSSAAWPSAWPRTCRRCTSPRCAPAHLRGRLVAINQLTIVIGILSAQIVNWLIAGTVPHGADGRVHPPVVERAVRLAVDVHGRGGRRRCCSSWARCSSREPAWLVKNGRPDRPGGVLAQDRRRGLRRRRGGRHPAARSPARRSGTCGSATCWSRR